MKVWALTFITLSLLFQGCMPDSLTKFKEDTQPAEVSASGGSSGSGSSSSTVDNSPTNLEYEETAVDFVVGLDMTGTLAAPTFDGVVTSFSISPDLTTNTGLTFNTTTGAITGTPTVYSPQTTYTVTASNSNTSTSTTTTIDVAVYTQPSGLRYSSENIVNITMDSTAGIVSGSYIYGTTNSNISVGSVGQVEQVSGNVIKVKTYCGSFEASDTVWLCNEDYCPQYDITASNVTSASVNDRMIVDTGAIDTRFKIISISGNVLKVTCSSAPGDVDGDLLDSGDPAASDGIDYDAYSYSAADASVTSVTSLGVAAQPIDGTQIGTITEVDYSNKAQIFVSDTSGFATTAANSLVSTFNSVDNANSLTAKVLQIGANGTNAYMIVGLINGALAIGDSIDSQDVFDSQATTITGLNFIFGDQDSIELTPSTDAGESLTFALAADLPSNYDTFNTSDGVIKGTQDSSNLVTVNSSAVNAAGSVSTNFTIGPIIAEPDYFSYTQDAILTVLSTSGFEPYSNVITAAGDEAQVVEVINSENMLVRIKSGTIGKNESIDNQKKFAGEQTSVSRVAPNSLVLYTGRMVRFTVNSTGSLANGDFIAFNTAGDECGGRVARINSSTQMDVSLFFCDIDPTDITVASAIASCGSTPGPTVGLSYGNGACTTDVATFSAVVGDSDLFSPSSQLYVQTSSGAQAMINYTSHDIQILEVNQYHPFKVHDTITGDTSGATGVIQRITRGNNSAGNTTLMVRVTSSNAEFFAENISTSTISAAAAVQSTPMYRTKIYARYIRGLFEASNHDNASNDFVYINNNSEDFSDADVTNGVAPILNIDAANLIFRMGHRNASSGDAYDNDLFEVGGYFSTPGGQVAYINDVVDVGSNPYVYASVLNPGFAIDTGNTAWAVASNNDLRFQACDSNRDSCNSFTITGTTNGTTTVSGISASDIARLEVGQEVSAASITNNRKIVAIGASTITLDGAASGSTAGDTITVSSIKDIRNIRMDNTFYFLTRDNISLQSTLGVGSNATYLISPPLPEGVTLDTATGLISGTSDKSSSLKSYTVTATATVNGEIKTVDTTFNMQINENFQIFNALLDADSYTLHATGAGMQGAGCVVTEDQIASNDINLKDITCILDGGELDIYNFGMNTTVRSGPGICNFIRVKPYSFMQYPYAGNSSSSTTILHKFLGCPAGTDSTTAPDWNLGKVDMDDTQAVSTSCLSDLSDIDSDYPDCDGGKFTVVTYTLQDTNNDDDCTNAETKVEAVTFDCAATTSSYGSCIGGPVTEDFGGDQLKLGINSTIFAVDGNTGTDVETTASSPISQGHTTNKYVANYIANNTCSDNTTSVGYTYNANNWADYPASSDYITFGAGETVSPKGELPFDGNGWTSCGDTNGGGADAGAMLLQANSTNVTSKLSIGDAIVVDTDASGTLTSSDLRFRIKGISGSCMLLNARFPTSGVTLSDTMRWGIPPQRDPFAGSSTNPFYTYECLDSAYDLKARIRLMVRDWDRVFSPNDNIDVLTYVGSGTSDLAASALSQNTATNYLIELGGTSAQRLIRTDDEIHDLASVTSATVATLEANANYGFTGATMYFRPFLQDVGLSQDAFSVSYNNRKDWDDTNLAGNYPVMRTNSCSVGTPVILNASQGAGSPASPALASPLTDDYEMLDFLMDFPYDGL